MLGLLTNQESEYQMSTVQDYDDWVREHHAVDIERVERSFLECAQLYINNKIPYKVLVIFCVDHLLNHKATRFIDREMYSVMSEIAIFATELAITIKRLEELLRNKAITRP